MSVLGVVVGGVAKSILALIGQIEVIAGVVVSHESRIQRLERNNDKLIEALRVFREGEVT